MNTILITGTVNSYQINEPLKYTVNIWGNRDGEDIQFITGGEIIASCYGDIWGKAKNIATKYFNEPKMDDGAYTQFLDHITCI